MRSAEIKRRFTDYFERNGHTVVPSASLILDDPTLLFVNAGMVPFKPYLQGIEPAPFPRATSVQKCVRTLDIDEVGKTARHSTFFQMAGNFSFGDYFKEGAITLAWELLTASQDDGGYGFDADRLWVTVYEDDDEAYDSGAGWSACPRSGSSAAGWPTTSGRWACPARAARARRSSSTAGPSTASRAARSPTRTATSRSGTWCSCRTMRGAGRRQGGLPDPRRAAEEEHRHRHGRRADGVPAAGRGERVRDRRGLPGRWPGRPSCPAGRTARTTARTSGCGWSPTTSARR